MRYSLGYTRDQIDQLTWKDYYDLHVYWKFHPPTHILLAGYTGYKAPTEIAPDANQDLAIEELMSLFPVKIATKEELLNV